MVVTYTMKHPEKDLKRELKQYQEVNNMLQPEKMEYVMLYFSKKNVKESLKRLGNASIVMLEKSGGEGQEPENICAVERTEQLLKYFEECIRKQCSEFEGVLSGRKGAETDSDGSFETVVQDVNSHYSILSEKNNHCEMLKENLIRIEEEHCVAVKVKRVFASQGDEAERSRQIIGVLADFQQKVILRKLLRTRLRRNVLIKAIDVCLSYSGRERTVIIAYTANQPYSNAAKKIIESMGLRGVLLEKSAEELEYEFKATRRNIVSEEREIRCILMKIIGQLQFWKRTVLRERRIIEALSALKDEGSFMIGQGWVPADSIPTLSKLCSSDTEKGRFTFEVQKHDALPPTSIRVTPVSAAFQNLTNVFGVPKYNEINPAIFLMFTFPFLFGAMFGDVLHGMILLFISLLMIKNTEKIDGKCGVFQIILDGRYIMLFCSFASIWFGLLYGDFGSLPISLFPSAYGPDGVRRNTTVTYLFGIDPVWHHAANGMVFINNVKMKLSLIIGFVHMGLGAVINICNAFSAADQLTLYCQAIPQFVSFVLFLGYVVFLCFYKWIVTHNYPSIINTLIAMYTEPFNIKESLYSGQLYVQLFVLSVMVICIPWMFFSKPIYYIAKRKVPESGILDLWISSGIHLVEFCLGLISNTSSYLRLWAVSLAHVQLTSVLHQFTLGSKSWIIALVTFPVYFAATFLLLIGLEGLSSALHALRLNWIEFFSKFYSGEGTLHTPFNFKEAEM